ncbi:hypothetical protein JW998_13045 [candidate division KSB1 bacterium]|nr:hypothetical protein [candidate division KSB1 bacterium]
MKIMINIVLVFLMLAFSVSAKTTVNKSIRIDEGERHAGGCTSVNGSIVVEQGAEVTGGCKTVNGSIKIARDCTVARLQSVNGSIRVGEKTEIRSGIDTVNGSIHCEEGVHINGSIETVNGSMNLQGTEVEDGITTYNGDVALTRKSIVHDDIIIKDSKGHNNRKEPLRITIDDSIVDGDIINREEDIVVIVYLKNDGQVRGDIYDARVEEE